MHLKADASYLHAHVDRGGIVHTSRDSYQASSSRLSVPEFVRSSGYAMDDVGTLCVIGCPRNAELIVGLYEQKNSALRKQRILIGNPLTFPRCGPCEPTDVLASIPEISNRQSWYMLTDKEYHTYAMMVSLARPGCLDDVTRQLAASHPAWPALSFIDSLDSMAGCRLLCHIGDPRWYKHPSRPNRFSCLFSHLGVSFHNVKSFVEHDEAVSFRFTAAQDAINSWYNYDQRESSSAAPRGFLWRSLSFYLDASGNLVKSILRTTRRFLIYLICYWAGAIETGYHELAFRPDEFFKSKSEIEAFMVHCRLFDCASAPG